MTPPSRIIPAILLEFSGRNRDVYPDFETMPDVAAISTLGDFVRLAGREISGGRTAA
jgi:single-stranded DNA-specific DHH superfamily exonuclease